MNNYRFKLVSAVLSGALLLTACTANTGVATNPSETAASDALTQSSGPDMSDMSVETVYGSQLPQYLNHQYYFEGEAVSLTESNFYFVDTFTELTQYAGYYYPATSDGYIDLSATIDATGMSEEMSQYSTYGDFFVAYSEQMLESALIINKLAADEGLTLPEETLAEIDSILTNLETTSAQPSGLTLDEYLSIYYGEGTTAESFRQTIINYYMADLYTQEFVDNYEFDESEIMVPNVRYTLYSAPQGTAEEDIAAAEEAATALLESADGDVDTFTVEAALAYTNGDTIDYGDIAVPNDGSLDATFTEWAWDESRAVGDIDMIYSPNFGYFVLTYLGETEIDESSKSQIAVQAMSEQISDAINNGTYEFYTSDEYAPAPTVAPMDPTLNTEETGITPDAGAAADGSAFGSLTGSKGLDVLLIALSSIGAVAVLGLAAVGVMHIAKKKDGSSGSESKKEDSDGDN
ncbi:MAG: hypothetical protein IJR15_08320 [Clostridiales bacterium]|nr:hypothetical protein [Clostridiales bacterium]